MYSKHLFYENKIKYFNVISIYILTHNIIILSEYLLTIYMESVVHILFVTSMKIVKTETK